MDFEMFQTSSPWQYYFVSSPALHAYQSSHQDNYVHWSQTPVSHVFSAVLPGVRKEEIKVEIEDSIYLIIRTVTEEGPPGPPAKSFMRKFRLPASIDIDGISAGYENGVLTVTVPRAFRRRNFFIDPSDVPERVQVLARAA